MTVSEYEKVWLSEGGGAPNPGYEEIIVQAIPYNTTESVTAVALRARDFARLKTDACPSSRYMNILIEGAIELGLEGEYIEYLKVRRKHMASERGAQRRGRAKRGRRA